MIKTAKNFALGSFKNPIKITDWCFIENETDGYTPPEMCSISIKGVVAEHPKKKMKTPRRMRTSLITEFLGRKIVTSNSVYRLGRISKEYRQWLKENYPKWNWRKPVNRKVK